MDNSISVPPMIMFVVSVCCRNIVASVVVLTGFGIDFSGSNFFIFVLFCVLLWRIKFIVC